MTKTKSYKNRNPNPQEQPSTPPPDSQEEREKKRSWGGDKGTRSGYFLKTTFNNLKKIMAVPAEDPYLTTDLVDEIHTVPPLQEEEGLPVGVRNLQQKRHLLFPAGCHKKSSQKFVLKKNRKEHRLLRTRVSSQRRVSTLYIHIHLIQPLLTTSNLISRKTSFVVLENFDSSLADICFAFTPADGF